MSVAPDVDEFTEPVAPPIRRTTATRWLLITDPAVEWSRRLAMVREARCFVQLLTYYVALDRWSIEMLDALTDARARGVAVLLGIDALGQYLGTQGLNSAERAELDARLAALGDGVRYYRPPRRLQRVLGGGHHVKIQLSEAGEALHGSSNLSHRSFEPDQWREVSFSLWGPAALCAFDTVAALFPDGVRPSHRAALAAAVEAPTPSGAIPLDYIWHDPNRPAPDVARWLSPVVRIHNPLTRRLVEAIDGARHTLRATSFYFKPCAELADAFERAARRGVAIEVFHSHRDALVESPMPWMAAAADLPRWFAAGVTVRESRRGEHAKLLLIDDAELAMGSYNFEHAAHDRLAELMVFVREPALIRQAAAHLDALRADPDYRPMDAATYAALPAGLRARTWLARPLRRWV